MWEKKGMNSLEIRTEKTKTCQTAACKGGHEEQREWRQKNSERRLTYEDTLDQWINKYRILYSLSIRKTSCTHEWMNVVLNLYAIVFTARNTCIRYVTFDYVARTLLCSDGQRGCFEIVIINQTLLHYEIVNEPMWIYSIARLDYLE